MLEGKARLLHEKRLRKKQCKTNSLTRPEEDILWKCDQLGDKTRKSTYSYSLVDAHSTFWVAGETTSLHES